MIQRNDKLQLTTDAGATIMLGWDYGLPYYIEGLSGVAVEMRTSQGANQQGVTLDGQSVGGVSRAVYGDIWLPEGAQADAAARRLLQTLPALTTGTMYFVDKYFARFAVEQTPAITNINGMLHWELTLFSPEPYWYAVDSKTWQLGGYAPAFSFPVNYAQPHQFGISQESYFVVANNPGAVAVPFSLRFGCTATVENPGIILATSGAYLRVLTTMEPGDVIEIYQSTAGIPAATLTRDGVQTNIFYLVDEQSTLFSLAAGDNVLRPLADTGLDGLQVGVSIYPAHMGVIPDAI